MTKKLGMYSRQPVFLPWRAFGDDCHRAGSWMKTQSELDRATDVRGFRHTGDARPHLLSCDPGASNLHKHDWHAREQLVTMSNRELQRRVCGHHYQVELLPAIGVSKNFKQALLVACIVLETTAFQILNIEIQWPRRASSYRGLQGVCRTKNSAIGKAV